MDAGDTSKARFGMWVFIGSEVLFFGGLIFAYAVAHLLHPDGFAAASRHTYALLGTLNTAVLLSSSALVALASLWGKDGHWPWCKRALMAAAALGLLFWVIKGFEYGKEWQEGLFPGQDLHLGPGAGQGPTGAELFFALYFVLTGLHAEHLLTGIGVLAWLARQAGRAPTGELAGSTLSRLEAGAMYGHFIDEVWILLYPLL